MTGKLNDHTDDPDVTLLLHRIRDGDRQALDELVPLVYRELRQIAATQMRRERGEHTLQPTALVNEAFLRMFAVKGPQLADRAHFLRVVSHTMRQVLVDHARARAAAKRGDGLKVPLDEQLHGAAEMPLVDLLAVESAIQRLEAEDPALARLVEMRFFAGMTAEETAEAVGESVHAVRHNLRYAQARLRTLMESGH